MLVRVLEISHDGRDRVLKLAGAGVTAGADLFIPGEIRERRREAGVPLRYASVEVGGDAEHRGDGVHRELAGEGWAEISGAVTGERIDQRVRARGDVRHRVGVHRSHVERRVALALEAPVELSFSAQHLRAERVADRGTWGVRAIGLRIAQDGEDVRPASDEPHLCFLDPCDRNGRAEVGEDGVGVGGEVAEADRLH